MKDLTRARILAAEENNVSPDVSSNPAEAEFNKSDFDPEDLVDRLMGNQVLAKRVAGAFIDSMAGELLALSAAISNSDAATIATVAHSIKGAAANAGGTAVSDLAAQLEAFGKSGAVGSASDVLPELKAKVEALRPAIQRFIGSQ